MRKRNKLVCGIGINDSDYKTTISQLIDGKLKTVWQCPFYTAWLNMMGRCYSKSVHKNQPTYIGCSVCPEWHYFMTFKAWMEIQDWEGKELDKDILVAGNKIYSPENCLFIDKSVNLFMSEKHISKRKLPAGIYKTVSGKFTAKCHDTENKKQKVVGTYETLEEAYKALLEEKNKNAKFLASQQSDQRVVKALLDKYKI